MTLQPTYQPDIYQSTFPAHGSRLVYGTSGLGGVWGQVAEAESIDCILFALENGITSFDTSPSYAHAEVYLGKALQRWSGERPFVSTKVGRLQSDTAFDAKLDYSPQGMKDSVKRSLEVLKLDKVDLLFLHEPQWVPAERIEEILKTLLSFKEEGLTAMLGVGGNPSPSFMRYICKKYFDVVSTFTKIDACNLSGFDDLLPATLKEGIAIYAASSLHFSLLGNRFQKFVREGNGGYEDNVSAQDIANAVCVNEIAKKYGLPLSTLAQGYLFSIKEATRVVMGARKIEQIESTVADWKAGALLKEIFDEVTVAILHNTTTTAFTSNHPPPYPANA